MTFAETVLLGALAGFIIYLGLPLARLGNLSNRTAGVIRRCSPWASWRLRRRGWRSSMILEEAVEHWEEGESGFGKVALFGLVLGGARRGHRGHRDAGAAHARAGARPQPDRRRLGRPRAVTAEEADAIAAQADAARRRAPSTGLAVAAAIGIHNFAEARPSLRRSGLRISLATILIIGFALHNATEGFGIIGLLGMSGRRGSGWAWRA